MTEATGRVAGGLIGLAIVVVAASKFVGGSLKVKNKMKSNGGLKK